MYDYIPVERRSEQARERERALARERERALERGNGEIGAFLTEGVEGVFLESVCF